MSYNNPILHTLGEITSPLKEVHQFIIAMWIYAVVGWLSIFFVEHINRNWGAKGAMAPQIIQPLHRNYAARSVWPPRFSDFYANVNHDCTSEHYHTHYIMCAIM